MLGLRYTSVDFGAGQSPGSHQSGESKQTVAALEWCESEQCLDRLGVADLNPTPETLNPKPPKNSHQIVESKVPGVSA